MPVKIAKLSLLFLLIALVTACSAEKPAGEAPASVEPAGTAVPTVLPGELFRDSGEGVGVAEGTFTLDQDARIRMSWEQSSQDRFILVLFNLDPEMEDTPFGRVTFEYVVGPSKGHNDWDLVAGEYGIEVQEGDGPWKVWIEEVVTE